MASFVSCYHQNHLKAKPPHVATEETRHKGVTAVRIPDGGQRVQSACCRRGEETGKHHSTLLVGQFLIWPEWRIGIAEVALHDVAPQPIRHQHARILIISRRGLRRNAGRSSRWNRIFKTPSMRDTRQPPMDRDEVTMADLAIGIPCRRSPGGRAALENEPPRSLDAPGWRHSGDLSNRRCQPCDRL
jgi:hypothetical protein